MFKTKLPAAFFIKCILCIAMAVSTAVLIDASGLSGCLIGYPLVSIVLYNKFLIYDCSHLKFMWLLLSALTGGYATILFLNILFEYIL